MIGVVRCVIVAPEHIVIADILHAEYTWVSFAVQAKDHISPTH
jgi:hypothetical protein